MESSKTSLQQEFELLNSSLPGLELPQTSQAPSSIYADLEAMIETINAEYPMLDQLAADPVSQPPPPPTASGKATTSSDQPAEKARASSQNPKRRRHLTGSLNADALRKKRTPPGRVNAPRQLNGRFSKLTKERTGKPLKLIRRDSSIEESQHELSETQDSAFTMPLPSEIVDELYYNCIMPHLTTDCMSEMEVLVRKNLFIKHYRPQLILFLASAHSGTTYKSLDALVAAAIRKLGF